MTGDPAQVIDLHTRRPRRPIPGHAGHFHPAIIGPVLIVTCPLCRERMAWHRAQLDAWEKENTWSDTTTRVENSARYWEALCRHRLMLTFTYRGAEMWLNTRQAVLDGRTPLEAIRAGQGERVHELIEQIEAGS